MENLHNGGGQERQDYQAVPASQDALAQLPEQDSGESTGMQLILDDASMQLFYEGIGQMTRMIHSATRDLGELYTGEIAKDFPELQKQPSTNFLNYVRNLTASATSRVLDKIEQTSPLIENSRKANEQIIEEIGRYQQINKGTGAVTPSDAMFEQILNHLQDNCSTMENLAKHHGEILTLQSYQDLTSQAITKAEKLLANVESTLAELLVSFSHIEGFDASLLEAEPHTEEETKTSAQLAQDEVDSLLSQLGF